MTMSLRAFFAGVAFERSGAAAATDGPLLTGTDPRSPAMAEASTDDTTRAAEVTAAMINERLRTLLPALSVGDGQIVSGLGHKMDEGAPDVTCPARWRRDLSGGRYYRWSWNSNGECASVRLGPLVGVRRAGRGSMARGERLCPACKSTLLNRYNNDLLCAPCTRAVKPGGVNAPEWLWDSLPMRRALANHELGTFVTILRAATGLSQLDLGNIFGLSQSAISLIETGQRDTLYDIRELRRFADACDIPRKVLLPVVLGLESDTLDLSSSRAFEASEGLAGVDRRSFTGSLLGLVTASGLDLIQVPDRADAAYVRYLRAGLASLREQDEKLGGDVALPQALRLFARARRIIDESDYTDSVGRELLMVGADLGTLCGWLAYENGDQKAARALYGEAGLLAGSADDAQTSIHVYLNMSQQSSYLARVHGTPGMAREALRFADRAAHLARHERSPRLHALIQIRQALAYVRLGDEPAFRRSLGQAKDELQRGDHPDDAPWTRFVTASEINGCEATGFVHLGSSPRAIDLYSKVVSDTRRSLRDRTHYRAYLAGALLHSGDRAQAINEGISILASGSPVPRRTLNELQPLRAASEQADAEEFRVRFDQAAGSPPA
ncbi:helix-turn-helix domain-containing protein [Spongiactinospora sp. 9N601]|uniref:helix-turn-helix domain-containing protein n=1 Tax=Spongiactinospora sp. 9N601 TaxID=3375149 RepID=UPI0037B61C7F